MPARNRVSLARLAYALTLVACSSRSNSAQEQTKPQGAVKSGGLTAADTDAGVASTLPPKPVPLGQDEIVVGSVRGLEAHRIGRPDRRMISAGPALYPRWIDPDTVLVVVPKQAPRADGTVLLAGGATLERIAVRLGLRRKLADISPFLCSKDATLGAQLSLQAADDFYLTGGSACLSLMDRSANMANLILRIRTGLSDGKVDRALLVGADECGPQADVHGGAPATDGPCEQAREEPDPGDKSGLARAYAFVDESLKQSGPGRKVRTVSHLEGYELRSVSPSGRWALLTGDLEEGDSLSYRLLLLDRDTGFIHPLPGRAGSWPEALAGQAPVLPVPIAQAALWPVETDLRWVERDGREFLVLGELLVAPLLWVRSVGGAVAR
jgi:hypothetical protein